MKNIIALLISLLFSGIVNGQQNKKTSFKGFEPMENLSKYEPDGKNNKWFHENELIIIGDSAYMSSSPIYIKKIKIRRIQPLMELFIVMKEQ